MAASLEHVWELQDAIAADVNEMLQQAKGDLACNEPNARKAQLLARLPEALAAVVALARRTGLCASCGIRKPRCKALLIMSEMWYSQNCGYCGKGAETSRELAKRSMLSRVSSEMNAVCQELSQCGVSARSLKPYRDMAEAAKMDLEPQPLKQLRMKSPWRAAALCGQLQRSRSIVPSKFCPAYDKALQAMGCE
jgi:hypothetical protein